jgi:hypothetical protein
MSGWIAGATLVGTIGGSLIGGSATKSAAKSANKTQERLTRETNQMNERLFHEARGRTGHAILPEYLGNAERDIGNDVIDIYEAQQDEEGLNAFGDEAFGTLSPAWNRGNQLIGDIFSGSVLEDRTKNLAGQASARRQGIQKALSERLADVDARRNAGGLGGGSSVSNRMMLGDTIGARQQAAAIDADAISQLYDQNLNLQLGLLDAPMTRANASYEFGYLPQSQDYRSVDEMLKRMSFFNIGTGQPYQVQTPNVQTVPNVGQFVGPAITQGVGAFANYMNSRPTTPVTTAAPAGGGALPALSPAAINSTYGGFNTNISPMLSSMEFLPAS